MNALLPPRVLIADDYAFADGVSRSIRELAAAKKISGTSAFVTFPRWREDAARLRDLRGHISIGLHFNLTVGPGDVPGIARNGRFPAHGNVVRAALARRLDTAALRAEVRRQLDLFEHGLGFPPDHVDGHQHVQGLPQVGAAVVAELAIRYRAAPPLVRNSGATPGRPGPARAKSLAVAAITAGFGARARRAGLIVNDGFAGWSGFDEQSPYRDEIVPALDRRGKRSRLEIVMCHPGYPDAELAALDPVTTRRRQEHDALMALAPPDATIWHPIDTRVDRPIPDWRAMLTGAPS